MRQALEGGHRGGAGHEFLRQMPKEMTTPQALPRRLNLLQSASLNMANMVGSGPFITIPLILATMGGPQAMIGWGVGQIGRASCRERV